MIIDFEDVAEAQKLLKDLAVVQLKLEVIHAALLDRVDKNMAEIIKESVETVNKTIDFLDGIVEVD